MSAAAWGSIFVATLALALPGGAEAAEPELAPPADEPVAVFGGDFVQSCGWPSTVSLEGQCTGTLVHPQVVIYAAHCGSGYTSVQFGEEIAPGHARSVPVQYCTTYPGYGPPGTDWALCVLAEPQLDIAIVPPLMGCEVDVLQSDVPVTIVGFGEAETGYGEKKEVTTGFGFIQANEAFLGGGGEDACFGDSGGPVFVQMPDSGSWRAFGITSYGSQNCMQGGYYSLMHVGMEWFEEESGFDLTPCHDAQGNWMPTPACQGFPMDPATAGGSWSDGCNPGQQAGAESTCGVPFDASADTDPPTVAFTNPANEARFDTDPATGSVQVAIDLEADDGDGFGVATVELRIDGESVPGGVLDHGPYGYTLTMPPGTFTFDAVAVDWSGNEGFAEPIYIGIDMDAEVPEAEDESGGASGSGDPTGGDDLPGGTMGGDDATGGVASAGADADGDEGCGCRSGRPGPGSLGLVVVGLLGLRRRRRG